jgi:hypothetical protein
MGIKQKLIWYSISSGSFLLRILLLPANLATAAATVYLLSEFTPNMRHAEILRPLFIHFFSSYDNRVLLFADVFCYVVLIIGNLIACIGILCRRGILLKAQIILISLVTFISVLDMGRIMFQLVSEGVPSLRTESDWIIAPDVIKFAIQEYFSCCGFNSSDTIVLPPKDRAGYCSLPSNRIQPNRTVTMCIKQIAVYDSFPNDMIIEQMLAYVAGGSAIYYLILVVNSFLIWHFRTNPKICRACCA